MNKVAVYIDGFNLYHSIKENKYKWLNLRKLSELFLRKDETLVELNYFSALAHWNIEKVNRHKLFLKALEQEDVKIILGEFKKVTRYCRNCKSQYKTHEEKQTDVNIAIELLAGAINDIYDEAIIISGDSDLITAIKKVKELFPNKKVGVILPIGRRSESLKQVCDFYMKMKKKHLDSSLFDEDITIADGKSISCPGKWKVL